MKNLKKILFCVITALFMGATQAAVADVVIIVNASNPVAQLSKDEAKRIYLGKDTVFANGEKIRPVDLAEGDEVRNKFYASVVEKSDAQVRAYWAQLIFTGKGTPPEILNSSADVKRWVAENKGGIGYVDSSMVDATVKVVMRVSGN